MGQSLSQLYVHLIFATKFRQPFIKKKVRGRLNAYITGILKNQESPSIRTNCVEDHVHILFRLSKNKALASVVEAVKKNSSKWMKEIEGGNKLFKWQIGYAAFSISGSAVGRVTKYIENQEEHHAKKSLRKEVERLIKEYDVIEYDERYFWD